jgi:hypothetical protein
MRSNWITTSSLALLVSSPLIATAQPVQWQQTSDAEPVVSPSGVMWQAVPAQSAPNPMGPAVVWQPVPAGEPAVPTQASPTPANTASTAPAVPKPFVTGGLYQVKRGKEWLPSISQRVPNAYGSTFGTLQTGLFIESCNVTGGYVCGSQDFSTEFKNQAKGIWSFLLGLGDPRKAIGVDLGFQITSLATTRPDQSSQGTSFGSGQGIDLAISRNLSEDFSVKLGVINLIKLDEVQQQDQPSSAYGVFSGRIDLGGDPRDNDQDLYFTIGVANGIYRPLNVILDSQEQACAKDVANKGYRSPGKYGDFCNIWGFSYGDPYPVASFSYLVNPQFSLIAEWWGRNLTLAASFKPFEQLNWVITPGITNVIKNADWDPANPGYTTTPRFQLTTSIGF